MAEPSMSADDTKQLEQLKLLFDYTKFHIGLYTTLAAAYIALMTSEYGKRLLAPDTRLVLAAVVILGIAGFAGGIIASSCTYYPSFNQLMERRLFPFRDGWGLKGVTWTRIEHTAFWVALGAILASFFIPYQSNLSLEAAAGGSVTLFGWTVPANGEDRRVVQLESDRTLVVCTEPGAYVTLILEVGTTKTQGQLGGTPDSSCQAVYGRTVSLKSANGQIQRGRVAIALDK
jgi:hypothetical protein